MAEQLVNPMQKMNTNDKNDKPVLGLEALAAKLPNHRSGRKVTIETNIRKLTIARNQPIYKYAVQVLYVYTKQDGSECVVEMSKSAKSGTEHENDKSRCQRVYLKAIERYAELKKGGPFFYDRQASMYSLSCLKNDNISFSVSEGICKRTNFVRAEFKLSKVDSSFQSTSNDIDKTVNIRPAIADRTLLEALNVIVSGPAYENDNVITVGPCVHYLIDPSAIRSVQMKEYPEGGLYSGLGASKAVKTLEGPNKTPTLYMTTEMKTTLFHPDYVPMVDLLRTYRGYRDTLGPNTSEAKRILKALQGCDVVLNYGAHKGLNEDGVIMKIRNFSTCAKENTFDLDGRQTTVKDYFKSKYGVNLRYPELFCIEAKGKKGKVHLPAEVLLLCPSQTVTNDQMINNEQADMIRMSAAQPHIRKQTTEQIVAGVGLASKSIYGFLQVDEPVKVEGMVLDKPKIMFGQNRVADLNNPKAKFPTDFRSAGPYFSAKSLQNWELCFVQREDVRDLERCLLQEMGQNGMKVTAPVITYFAGSNDLERVFKNAKAAKRQMLFFVVKSAHNFHQQIKALEQKYDILTQEIRAETAYKVATSPQTRLNIVNKTNMKLGGLNYYIGSSSLSNNGRLVVGFETSQRGGGSGSDMPIAVGFAANMMDHVQKFAGGYVYVKRERDIYGPILKDTMVMILKQVQKARVYPTQIIIYFNGVSEGQFALLNETYFERIKDACKLVSDTRPHITIIASSKTHNERLYLAGNKGISNLEPGTVIDHTIVSPVYNEFYLASAVARQGTTKTTKFTVVRTTCQEPLSSLETLTNDLCYDHQIVFQPVGLPVPLFIAGRYSQRGANNLTAPGNGAIYNKQGEVDVDAINKAYGYQAKELFGSRFNA